MSQHEYRESLLVHGDPTVFPNNRESSVIHASVYTVSVIHVLEE